MKPRSPKGHSSTFHHITLPLQSKETIKPSSLTTTVCLQGPAMSPSYTSPSINFMALFSTLSSFFNSYLKCRHHSKQVLSFVSTKFLYKGKITSKPLFIIPLFVHPKIKLPLLTSIELDALIPLRAYQLRQVYNFLCKELITGGLSWIQENMIYFHFKGKYIILRVFKRKDFAHPYACFSCNPDCPYIFILYFQTLQYGHF